MGYKEHVQLSLWALEKSPIPLFFVIFQASWYRLRLETNTMVGLIFMMLNYPKIVIKTGYYVLGTIKGTLPQNPISQK